TTTPRSRPVGSNKSGRTRKRNHPGPNRHSHTGLPAMRQAHGPANRPAWQQCRRPLLGLLCLSRLQRNPELLEIMSQPRPIMDFFTPVVPVQSLHSNFRRLADKHSAADRAVLSQWAEGFKDRDGKFVREFQTTFNSGFWELYIFACCKELGFHVNLAFSSPDFVVDNFHNEYCIEAAIASNAIGDSAERERELTNKPTPPNL